MFSTTVVALSIYLVCWNKKASVISRLQLLTYLGWKHLYPLDEQHCLARKTAFILLSNMLQNNHLTGTMNTALNIYQCFKDYWLLKISVENMTLHSNSTHSVFALSKASFLMLASFSRLSLCYTYKLLITMFMF